MTHAARLLTERIAAGDLDAMDLLYKQYAAVVYAVAWRILRDRGAAEDVVQATFTQALQQAGRVDADRGTAAAWLVTIARSRALDQARAGAVRARRSADTGEESAPASTAPDPERAVLAGETAASLREAIGTLPVPQRLAVELAFFEGLTHGEIAAVLRQPLGTVKTRIRSGLGKLREALTAGECVVPQAEPSPFSVALAEHLSARAPEAADASDGALAGLQVLVVDDDGETVELVRAVLESAGAAVVSARSSAEAIVRLRTSWPHMMLADLGMPGEDGYALLRRAQQLANAADRPLRAAAFTARAGERSRTLGAGFAAHLVKPIAPGAIVELVRSLAGRTSPDEAVQADFTRAGRSAPGC